MLVPKGGGRAFLAMFHSGTMENMDRGARLDSTVLVGALGLSASTMRVRGIALHCCSNMGNGKSSFRPSILELQRPFISPLVSPAIYHQFASFHLQCTKADRNTECFVRYHYCIRPEMQVRTRTICSVSSARALPALLQCPFS